MPITPKHSVSVAGVVVNSDEQVLLVQRRDNGHWEPPGGVLELEETFESGVRREILEETGITVEVDQLTGVYKNLSRGVVALVFRCHTVSGSAHSTDESADVAWFDLPDALERMTEAYAVRVADAFIDRPSTRSHDGTHLVQS